MTAALGCVLPPQPRRPGSGSKWSPGRGGAEGGGRRGRGGGQPEVHGGADITAGGWDSGPRGNGAKARAMPRRWPSAVSRRLGYLNSLHLPLAEGGDSLSLLAHPAHGSRESPWVFSKRENDERQGDMKGHRWHSVQPRCCTECRLESQGSH